MFNLKKVNDYEYEIPKTGPMKVKGTVFINDALLSKFTDDEPLKQVSNVASMPGIVEKSIAMPDIHLGYGFPIGGVAAFDYDEGIISPGGVGYDINCGVSLLKTSLTYADVRDKITPILDNLYRSIPVGIEYKSSFQLNSNKLNDIISSGLSWAYSNGYATKMDMGNTEEQGKMDCGYSNVSEKALKRGINELGTLGGGNHFLEIQRVDSIFDKKIAKKFGIEKDQILIMIHTGSRGLGHQVASDFMLRLNESDAAVKNEGDKQLISAYTKSREGQDYIDAMNAAANYGFVNRQIIVYKIRKVFEDIFRNDFESMGMELVYSLAHNMAKIEEHEIDNKRRKLIVHRKGATRAFPKDIALGNFSETGYPVIIPGDMGTSSYIMVGTRENMKNSFGSSCHGAGRLLSRKKANENFTADDIITELNSRGIYIRAATKKAIAEEAPDSYKDIDEVIKIVNGANIAHPVTNMKPLAVMKG